MSRPKTYYLILDTETAPCEASNEVNPYNMFVYDLGFAIVDRFGNVYHSESLIIDDIFNQESNLMQSAYYASKLPQYHNDIANGTRQVVSFYEARKRLTDIMTQYNCDTIIAHNMRFDYGTLNNTQRWLTKSKYRYFFASNIKIWDTMRMAEDTICKLKKYQQFCASNGYTTKTGRPRKTAEVLYRFIASNNEFVESHTALEDVMIEKEIFAKCNAMHKKMRRECFASNAQHSGAGV